MLRAVSLNAEDTSEGTAAEDREKSKDKALLNKPPEYGQIRRLLKSASVSNKGKRSPKSGMHFSAVARFPEMT